MGSQPGSFHRPSWAYCRPGKSIIWPVHHLGPQQARTRAGKRHDLAGTSPVQASVRQGSSPSHRHPWARPSSGWAHLLAGVIFRPGHLWVRASGHKRPLQAMVIARQGHLGKGHSGPGASWVSVISGFCLLRPGASRQGSFWARASLGKGIWVRVVTGQGSLPGQGYLRVISRWGVWARRAYLGEGHLCRGHLRWGHLQAQGVWQ